MKSTYTKMSRLLLSLCSSEGELQRPTSFALKQALPSCNPELDVSLRSSVQQRVETPASSGSQALLLFHCCQHCYRL